MTFSRISSTSFNSWGGAYQQAYRPAQRQQTVQTSIWSDAPFRRNSSYGYDSYDYIASNNGVENVRYIEPGASYAPITGVMTAPFGANVDILGSNYNSNPFGSTTISTTSIFEDSDGFSRRRDFGGHDHRFLSLADSHRNNIFKTTRVDSDSLDDIHVRNSRTRGAFGTNVRRTDIVNHSNGTRISEQSNNFGSLARSNSLRVSGDIESVSRTSSHSVTPHSNLTRTVTRVEDEDNIYKIKHTQGKVW